MFTLVRGFTHSCLWGDNCCIIVVLKCVLHLGKLEAGESRNILCSRVHVGRFLSIYLDHDGILSLAEVEVFECKLRLDL